MGEFFIILVFIQNLIIKFFTASTDIGEVAIFKFQKWNLHDKDVYTTSRAKKIVQMMWTTNFGILIKMEDSTILAIGCLLGTGKS